MQRTHGDTSVDVCEGGRSRIVQGPHSRSDVFLHTRLLVPQSWNPRKPKPEATEQNVSLYKSKTACNGRGSGSKDEKV